MTFLSRFCFSALCAFSLIMPCAAQAGPEIQVADNVIVVPDSNAKSTTMWMVIKAGCQDEENGNCHGIAHYVEHLVFLGRSADHKVLANRLFPDSESNGFTTQKSTTFWQKFPLRADGQTGDLEKIFRYYSDHLQALDVTEDEAARERNVVMQEYEMRYGRSAERRFFDVLSRDLYPDHPLGQDPLGSKEDIAAFTTNAARAFHAKWYSRDNAMLVVYGPVDPDGVKALAEKYLSPLPHRHVPERDWLTTRLDFSPLSVAKTVTDKDVGEKAFVLERLGRYEEPDTQVSLQARQILRAFLSSSLDDSPQATFVDKLDIAKSATGVIDHPADGAIESTLWATPKDNVGDAQMAAAMQDYLKQLAQTGMSQKTFDRLRKRIAEGWVQDDKDPNKIAETLVGWFDDHQTYQDYQDRSKALSTVSLDDVNRLLTAIAQSSRQVSGSLSPEH